jgi:nucleoside-diphosphate-sugar epimerase
MHTILGAGGPIANELTPLLLHHQEPVRLVSRRPVTQYPGAPWLKADLTKRSELLEAVKGSSVIYMTAGLTYDRKVWAREWPLIAQNLVDAARETGARLLFFDNVYMYGRVQGPMTENTPHHPSSVKGEIRARIARTMMDEAQKGNIRLTIARSADFYGTNSPNSVLDSMVLAKLARGQKAMWIGDPATLHSFTYVPDAARALYTLGRNPETDNAVWHLPTAPALTGIELMELAARVFGARARYTKVNRFMLKAIGLFNKPAGESAEMYYQNQYDYIFDSSRFEKAFGVRPTAYSEGIEECARRYYDNRN